MNDYPEGLPCWAPGAADFLASILTGDEVAVEWGGGQSTAWLAPKVFHLHTVEHDIEWVRRIANMTSEFDNVTMHHHPFEDPFYVEVLHEMNPAPVRHVWLIDGYRRIDCLDYALRKADEGDIVVCDDALDYAEHLLYKVEFIHRFDMPHPHAGLPCVSAKNTRDRNTVRTHAPATKETWVWRV